MNDQAEAKNTRDPRAAECGVASIERWLMECRDILRETPGAVAPVADRIENCLDALAHVRASGAQICDELDEARAKIVALQSACWCANRTAPAVCGAEDAASR